MGDRPTRRTAARSLFFTTLEKRQREDLWAIETIEAVVEIVDAELIEYKEYAGMGKNTADRVKTLLGDLVSMRRSKGRGYNDSNEIIP